MKPLQPGDPGTLGSYTILGRIGSGGMGVVYLGRSPSGRMAAVKLVRPEIADDAEFRARFRREIDTARQVSGAFTAAVLDADPDADQPWLATAHVEGPSLREKVFADGPLPLPEVRALGAGLAEALADLHRVGLVHRDVKPGNVLLAADGPRLIDFGIIRSDALADLTESGFVLGSAGFMAPEQAEGEHTGPAADVFALGAVVTFAAVGHGPFGSGSAATLLLRTVSEEPDLAGLPDGLRGVVRRCLARDPVLRPTARELVGLLAPGAEWFAGRSPAVAGRDGSGGTDRASADLGKGSAVSAAGSGASAGSVVAAGSGTRRVYEAPGLALPAPAIPPTRLEGSPGQHFQAPQSRLFPAYQPPNYFASRRDLLSAGVAAGAFIALSVAVVAGAGAGAAHPTSSRNQKTLSLASTVSPVWQATDGASAYGSSLSLSPDGATLYVGGEMLVALSPATGELKWKAGNSIGAVTGESSAIYVTEAGNLAAVAPDRGMPLWSIDTKQPAGNHDQTISHVGSALVCVFPTASGGPTVIVFDDKKQTTVWSATYGLNAAIAVAPSSGLVLVADADAKTLTALRTADGTQAWKTSLSNLRADRASVVTIGKQAFVGGSALEGFDLDSGDTQWTYYPDDPKAEICLAADDQLVYTLAKTPGDRTGPVYARLPSRSTLAWLAGGGAFTPSADSTSALAANGWLYVADLDNQTLTALDASGNIRWTWQDASSASRPGRIGLAADKDRVYAGFGSGVYAFPAH